MLEGVVHFRLEDEQEGACHTWRSGRPVDARLLERPLRHRTPCRETSAEGQTSISTRNGDILSHKMGHLIEERIGDLGITMPCLPPWFRCVRMLLGRNIQNAVSLPPTHPQAVNVTFEAVLGISRVYLRVSKKGRSVARDP